MEVSTLNSKIYIFVLLCFCLLWTNAAFGQIVSDPDDPDIAKVDSIKSALERGRILPDSIVTGREVVTLPSGIVAGENDSIMFASDVFLTATDQDWEKREVVFIPDPKRAVWLSALFPGLGQIYNRRYWKLPILVGGYMGLTYATSWNSSMLKDYTQAYSDIMDSDPTTKSYMNLFPKTVKEEDLDKTWLTNTLKARKDYFRRNRDLCIIAIVGVYLVAMVDAYVDASLANFDISPDLSLQWSPAVIQDGRNKMPSVGLQWALNF